MAECPKLKYDLRLRPRNESSMIAFRQAEEPQVYEADCGAVLMQTMHVQSQFVARKKVLS